MRMPWGQLKDIGSVFLRQTPYDVIGCLSFEDRCCHVPQLLCGPASDCVSLQLVCVDDPIDATPDYSQARAPRIASKEQESRRFRPDVKISHAKLLATEDDLLASTAELLQSIRSNVVVLDISCFPKRFFCFYLKRLLADQAVRGMVVTYTESAPGGYASGHLAEDPMTPDHLPGFAPQLQPKGNTLVLSVGFEMLRISSLMKEIYDRDAGSTKVIMPFPPDGAFSRRCWKTLYEATGGADSAIRREDIEMIATWDADRTYHVLREQWESRANGLTLAPFGPKPITLGMALYAIERDAGIYYTQPKAYNPTYSQGAGASWAYVVKWDGIACQDRKTNPI